MDGEGHRIALPKRDDLSAALHARPLFGQHKLAACEVGAGLGEQNRDLNREREIAIEILVEAVEVPRDVLQQERRWTRLTSGVASFKKRRVVIGITLVNSHPAVPCVGHG
jgi:hypothetical protein